MTDPPRSEPPSSAPRPAEGRVRDRAWWARNLRSLPNQITLARVISLPVLWGMAAAGRAEWVGIGVALAASTDMLDGWLSRARRETTAFGSRLDSVADHLLTFSCVAFLLILRPEFFRAEAAWLLTWSAFALGVLAVSLLRTRRWVDLHLFSAKVAVVLGYVFVVWILVLGTYFRAHFFLTLGAMYLAGLEALLVIVTRRRVDEHLGSIFLRRKK